MTDNYHKDNPHEPESYQEGRDRRLREEAVEIERRKQLDKNIDSCVENKLINHRSKCKNECTAMLELKVKYENVIPNLETSVHKVEESVIKIYEKMDKMAFWVITAAIAFIGSIIWGLMQTFVSHIGK